MFVSQPISKISGIGKASVEKLNKLGIFTIGDLIDYWPRKYNDFSSIQLISSISPGIVSLRVRFRGTTSIRNRRAIHITKSTAYDESGAVGVIWFNQPYRKESLIAEQEYFLSGKLSVDKGYVNIVNPLVERVSDFPTNTARILPKYKETKGLNSTQIRKYLRQIANDIEKFNEFLPDWVINSVKIISASEARFKIHFPERISDISLAKKRLAFEEIFPLILASKISKSDNLRQKSVRIKFEPEVTKQIVKKLPFKLTLDQQKAIWEILSDMHQSKPMNRMVEGDVGSGKTVVAAISAINAISRGFQVIMIAPTEILARQHYNTISRLFSNSQNLVNIQLLTSSTDKKTKDFIKHATKAGEIDLIIGTHALLEDNFQPKNPGLVIVDEQHRFGVRQRQKLISKAGYTPHLLSLTATPIPRSLALIAYGEMDVSIIKQKPADRKTTATSIVSIDARPRLYNSLKSKLKTGQQMYVIAPSIESDLLDQKQSVTKIYKELSEKFFKDFKIGLMHGKLPPREKQKIMQQFLEGEFSILVSTTVVEVGVDIPNSNIIVIEDADVFGLAQIHQLRGRVGRGKDQGYCYLVTSTSGNVSTRLRALESSNDGFKLAELDLEIRGPGEIYGTSQHGLLDLRLVKLSDTDLIKQASDIADEFIRKDNLVKYSKLNDQINKLREITHLN